MNKYLGMGLAIALGLLIVTGLGVFGAPAEKIVLEHADTLRSRGGARELIGHVKVTRAGTTILSDRALYTPDQGKITLTGGVRLTDPERKMTAQRVDYDERSGNFQATGGVDMTMKDSVRIQCESVDYKDLAKTAELFDEVIIDIYQDSSRITGNYGHFRTSDSSGYVEGDAVYKRPEVSAEKTDTLTITSEKLTFSRRDNSAIFIGNVKLTNGEILSVSDSLYHLPDSSMTRLTGAPLIWRGEDELAGNFIEMQYEGKDLRKILVKGKAIALSPAKEGDRRRNRLAGKLLTLNMIDDSTRVIQAEGDAEGWYFIFDKKEGYQGVNVAAANMIRLNVVNKRTDDILLDGQTSGAFYPPGQEPPGIGDEEPPKMDGIGWGEL